VSNAELTLRLNTKTRFFKIWRTTWLSQAEL